jgi:uncharacterized protein YndB with AHSA1/START domain
MNKIIHHSIRLECNAETAFAMFTVSEHLEKWLTQEAHVEPKVGGKYELFWNPKDRENDSTVGCKILAIRPNRFLAFEWKGPRRFKRFMNNADPLTQVMAFFIPCEQQSEVCTEVYLMHSGWRGSKRWEEARQWFDRTWAQALSELQKYVKPG